MSDLTQLQATVTRLAADVRILVEKALNTPPDDTAGVAAINDQLDAMADSIEAIVPPAPEPTP